jgi:hypothetical protein
MTASDPYMRLREIIPTRYGGEQALLENKLRQYPSIGWVTVFEVHADKEERYLGSVDLGGTEEARVEVASNGLGASGMEVYNITGLSIGAIATSPVEVV